MTEPNLFEKGGSKVDSPEAAANLGMQVGTIIHNIGVVTDQEPSSAPICSAFVAGLVSVGCNQYLAGPCPVAAACMFLPKEAENVVFIGCPVTSGDIRVMFYQRDGRPLPGDQLRLAGTEPTLVEWGLIGQVRRCDVQATYCNFIGNSDMKITGYIVIDCACGSASDIAPEALSRLGADITAIDSDLNRRRKPRNPGAIKSELIYLSNFVNASTGSIGVSYNGDGTHLAVIDENGKYISQDAVLAMLLMYLEPRTAIVPFDSSAIIEDAFNSPMKLRQGGHGDDPDRRMIRAVGDQNILEACIANDADFAALSDGRIIFPEITLCPDAIYASAVVAELSGLRSLRNIVSELPLYFSKHVQVEFNSSSRVFNKKITEAQAIYGVNKVVANGNAWKMFMDHGQFTLSADGQTMHIFQESQDQQYLTTMTVQAEEMVRSCL